MIVDELEKGDLALEQSLTLFEEGMKLSSSCHKELEEAEGKVEILLKQNGKLQAEPFESLTEKTPARGQLTPYVVTRNFERLHRYHAVKRCSLYTADDA